jgi:putative oxygen-independent coproporphyrinogen III oxidase
MEPFGVYVHIPFCDKRCDYCAFATWTDRHHLIDDYVAACVKEIDDAQLPIATTVFLGGGTPSLLSPAQLGAILDRIERTPDAEVTVECNPDTVTAELMQGYKDAGVNRISMGVQSMVPHVLASLGRTHDVANVHSALKHVANAGIERANVDLIYGAKGETVADWTKTVEAVLALDPVPTHVSAYALTVEPGTPLAKDTIRHPDDDDQADKYSIVDDLLSGAGLHNYEISNWSTPGNESEHNFLYWRQQNYRGIGCAAHSHEDGRRWWNIRTPDRYIKAIKSGTSQVADEEVLDEPTRRFEALELMLRTKDGVPAQTLPVDELQEFVEVRDGRAVLTRRGKMMANEVALRLDV